MIGGMPGTPSPPNPAGVGALPSPGQALAACHVAVLLFGFAGLFGKWIAWDATAIVLGRTLVAAAALAVVVRVTQGRLPKLEAGVAGNGVILAVHWTAFFAAIQVSTVAIGLLGFASFPLFVPVFERALLRAKVTPAKVVAMTLVSLGLVLVVPDVAWNSALAQGLAWGILSGATFAWLTVRTQRLVARHPASGIALWQNAVAAAVLLPVVIVRVAMGGNVVVVSLHDVVLVLILGTVCTALAHTLFATSLVRVSATVAAVCVALEPVYGAALAYALLGEAPGARVMAGMALLVIAAVVASWRARRA